MSYRIEYQWNVFHVPAESIGLQEDRFVVAIEGGDNNVCNARTGKRARSWSVCMIGTAVQVLKQAVHFAGACEGGGLKPNGRDCTPEAYIRRVRRLIEQSLFVATGWWTARLHVVASHAIVADVRGLGLEPAFEKWFGADYAVIPVPPARHAEFFHLVDRYSDQLPAWAFANVGGLRSS